MKSKDDLEMSLESVIYVSWEESERGWGTRPDGCSLHLGEIDYRKYVKDYWDRQPDKINGLAPDEYSRPAGSPVEVFVSQNLYNRIKESENGLRFWKHQETKLVSEKELVYGEERSGWVGVKK